MRKTKNTLLALSAMVIGFTACKKDDPETPISSENHDIAIVTNILSSDPATSYVGTLKDLSVGSYEVSTSRQSTITPFVVIDGNDVFVIQNKSGDQIIKYQRSNGLLEEAGSFSVPSNAGANNLVIESKDRGFISLRNEGKIAIFNPTTMSITSYIDLTSYAIADGSPDPTNLVLKDGKLYVGCQQTSDGYSSVHPVQILIIDLNNNNAITSATDSRSTYAGAADDQHAMFFDEKGDLYIFNVASYGFVPGQKCGFLRIKNGESDFDPDYFFNVTDYSVAGIPGNRVDYFQHIKYSTDGILFGAGNIYALNSNPPDYVNDRTVGAFKVDIYNQTITKIDLPYANGYSASLTKYQDKILWGWSTATGVGIYTYDLNTGETSDAPVVTTQGDPSVIEIFK